MMRMDYGMPTLAGLDTLEENVRLCAELGLSFIELNMNLPGCQAEALDVGQLCRWKEEFGIYFTLHLDENLNPCDFNRAVSAAYLDTTLRAVALARAAGMLVLNMHMNPGVHFKLPDGPLFLFDRYRDHYLNTLKSFRDACSDAAKESGVLICVENTDGFAAYEREGVELLLESDAFALTLDIGHAHCAGYADAAFYGEHQARLAHMHIHDANDRTCHLPLGTGALDTPAVLELARGRACRCVIEVKAPKELTQSVGYIRKIEEESHGHAR